MPAGSQGGKAARKNGKAAQRGAKKNKTEGSGTVEAAIPPVPRPRQASDDHAGGPPGVVPPVPSRPEPSPAPDHVASGQAPLARSRLFTRLAGTIMTGIQFLPGTEALKPGLLVAAAVILILDVLIEVGTAITTSVRALWNAVSVDSLFAGRDHQGHLRVSGGIVFRALPARPKVRIAARTVSAVLIAAQSMESIEELHTELLLVALGVLLLDVVTQVCSRTWAAVRNKARRARAIQYTDERGSGVQGR
ncbi:hypothetical protein OHB07_38980 (plasmid) [Streptomyces sp. NBC_00111]|uniref:hypothetical protein n=1 Tax=Streptomyces sp. NBC_00111 TaxID=2975655 RepID=UPI002F9163E7